MVLNNKSADKEYGDFDGWTLAVVEFEDAAVKDSGDAFSLIQVNRPVLCLIILNTTVDNNVVILFHQAVAIDL